MTFNHARIETLNIYEGATMAQERKPDVSRIQDKLHFLQTSIVLILQDADRKDEASGVNFLFDELQTDIEKFDKAV